MHVVTFYDFVKHKAFGKRYEFADLKLAASHAKRLASEYAEGEEITVEAVNGNVAYMTGCDFGAIVIIGDD